MKGRLECLPALQKSDRLGQRGGRVDLQTVDGGGFLGVGRRDDQPGDARFDGKKRHVDDAAYGPEGSV